MPNEVLTTWERLRATADNADADVLERLSRVYATGYRDISPAVLALVEKMEADLKAGKLTAAQVRTSGAYRALLRDVRRELDDFSAYLRTEIRTNATESATRGAEDGRALLIAAVAQALGVSPKDVPQDVIAVIAPDSLDFLREYLDPEGPLFERIATLSQYWEQQIADGILEKVGIGWNPRKIGEWITDEYGLGLTDGLRMTRTVQLYSYRQSNNAAQVANADLLQGVVWSAELDDRVCMSCVALHGRVFPVGTIANDHHNGRCAMLPWVKGTPNPVEQTGLEWFADQPQATQSAMLGPEKYAAWKDGKFGLGENLSKPYNDDVYGEMRREASLKDLLGND